MAPNKKKDKPKASEWLECSLCKKLVSSQDAESHSSCCSADRGYINNKVLWGKLLHAESLLGEDGSAVTKSIRDKDSVVWLAIQTMQVCGLSIGQPCLLNSVLVKRAWPHKSVPLPAVAVSSVTREELGVDKDDVIKVQRVVLPDHNVAALSVVLRLKDDNPRYKTDEFSSFVSGYLDGKLLREGTPILMRYFGQTCKCSVEKLVGRTRSRPSPLSSQDATPQSPGILSSSTTSTTPGNLATPATPVKHSRADIDSSLYSTPANHFSKVSYGPGSPLANNTPGKDLSDSIASLSISDASLSASPTFSPAISDRSKFPNLVTPVKGEGEGHTASPVCPVLARVMSQETLFSVIGPADGEEADGAGESNKHTASLGDVGGLSSQTEELKMRINRALHPSSAGQCLLLYGPAGTGKSLLVKALTSDLGLPTTMLAGTDVWSRLFGEAESNLRKIFKTALDRAPSIIVVDDIDVICPKHSQNSAGQQEHRIVATFLSLIDDVCSKKHASARVVVLGVTNNRDGLDPALRRAGRFGSEIEVAVPNASQRTEILMKLLTPGQHNLSEENIADIAANAHGYVGADLAALVNEANMHAMSARPWQPLSEGRGHTETRGHTDAAVLTMDDLVFAGQVVKPSALREIQLEVPKVHWSDIGGMSEVKMRLREAVELPLSHPEVFTSLGIEPPRGLLMYGPPGCSKTMVARALATECKLNFLAVKGPELFNQYVGESEKAIREVFRKARSAAPSVIFFDEIDAISAKRGSSSGGSGVDDRVLTQLLTEMDGLEFLKNVFIMAATNRPDKIDDALLRPGRFDSLVYVPLPDAETRREILQNKFLKMSVEEDVCVASLVKATEGYSGAEVVQVCQEAALYALREDLKATSVQQRHFEAALCKVKPQARPELLQVYEQFSNTSIK